MTTQNRVMIMGAGLSKSELEMFAANWGFAATDVPEPAHVAEKTGEADAEEGQLAATDFMSGPTFTDR